MGIQSCLSGAKAALWGNRSTAEKVVGLTAIGLTAGTTIAGAAGLKLALDLWVLLAAKATTAGAATIVAVANLGVPVLAVKMTGCVEARGCGGRGDSDAYELLADGSHDEQADRDDTPSPPPALT